MENQEDELLQNLEQYEAQLTQIREALRSPSSSTNKQDLHNLEKDIKELISLTKESLRRTKPLSLEESTPSSEKKNDLFSEEYEIFKAELAELELNSTVEHTNTDEVQTQEEIGFNNISSELQEDFDALKGSKCQAPYKKNWGDVSYYNALIVDLETKDDSIDDIDHIQVRVLFVNPTEKNMLPCPYFLEGDCKFTDNKCHFSHGQVVPLSSIREYREPDFSSVKIGSQVLAKQKDNVWHRGRVEDTLSNDRCLVKFESKSCETVELDLHDLLPLESDNINDDSESSSDNDEFLPHDYFVQLSLLRNPPNYALGAWEKHTKGIGSRLMANMGYVIGCGLGKHGKGRLEPIEAVAYPPGKSLDACMALREAARGDQNLFNAERRQKRRQCQLQQKQLTKQHRNNDVFTFINSRLAGCVPSTINPDSSEQTTLASSSRKGLNVERFRLGESIKKKQKDIQRFKQSLQRHVKGSLTHKAINSKLEEAQTDLDKLQNSDKLIAREQDQRDGQKKMAVF